MEDSSNGNGQNDQNAPNTEKTSYRPGPVHRTVAKAKDSVGLSHESKEAYEEFQDNKGHPHPRTEDLVNTIGFSLIQELMQYVSGPDGEAALQKIFTTQATVAGELALSEGARHASRVAAQEVVTGSYDAVQQKGKEVFKQVPPHIRSLGFLIVASYGTLLAIGFVLALWRFALFGLS